MFKRINDEIDGFNSLEKKFENLFKVEAPIYEESTVSSRFVQLFEEHNIHRNQIPRFFGNGLTLADIETNTKLLPKLTPELLQAAADLFAIRIEWLEGVDEQVYPIHHFYKHPEWYAEFLHQLGSAEENRVIVKLVCSTDSNYEQYAVLVLEETFDYLGNEPIVRYHLCGDWVNKYWKSRADLTACIAITLKQVGFIKGFKTPARIDQFAEGHGFVSELYSLPYAFKRDWLFRKRFEIWNPESWTEDPIAFLDGIDEGDFGKASALERWLYYFDKGLMDTGSYQDNASFEFIDELKKYK
ncbi:MAG: hypothetical protein QM500_15120 [Methylococcales bacterium]